MTKLFLIFVIIMTLLSITHLHLTGVTLTLFAIGVCFIYSIFCTVILFFVSYILHVVWK